MLEECKCLHRKAINKVVKKARKKEREIIKRNILCLNKYVIFGRVVLKEKEEK